LADTLSHELFPFAPAPVVPVSTAPTFQKSVLPPEMGQVAFA
jgi:hypothetical protein